MFILVMQFFWKYIDDLMGKGLELTVILELLFYVSASLIPLALPLAILLSSIMTLGNLAENNELVALKAAGLSLYRILRPLIIVVSVIAIATFLFANYIIPVANLKWRALIYDIQNTKISSLLTPGAYTKELEGYAIKVSELKDNSFKDIIIHDHSGNNEIKTIQASTGAMYKSNNGKFLYFELKNGSVIEELQTQPPLFDNNGNPIPGTFNNRPSRRSTFEKSIYKLDVSGLTLERSDEELFTNEEEMLNVFQIKRAQDSLEKKSIETKLNFAEGMLNEDLFYQAIKLDTTNRKGKEEVFANPLPPQVLKWSDFSDYEKKQAVERTQAHLRRRMQTFESQASFLQMFGNSVRDFKIEVHRKFALTAAIMVLFFVGAPLGAIVRKGGFGAPVVIAALLFMVYFVLISVGESLSKSDIVAPWIGMWFATFIMTPFAIWLMRSAANDSPLFVMDNWVRFFEKLRKR